MVSKYIINQPELEKVNFAHKLVDTTVPFDLRIIIIIAVSGAIGNTLGFCANFFLYGMTIPTAICGGCALLLLLNVLFGLSSSHYRIFGWIMLIMLDVFEFPLLVFAYGPVMYPYLMIGFLGLLMLAKDHWRMILSILLAIYDVAVIILSSLHPYVFGAQDSVGLMGSAIVTYAIALGALTGCVMCWKSVSVIESSDIDSVTGAMTRAGFFRNAEHYFRNDNSPDTVVLYFDVKNFKVVNSICGMEGGNKFLRRIVQQMKASELKPQFICRMNADHFVCLVDVTKLQFDRINELCCLEYTDKGKSIQLFMHCGVYFAKNNRDSVQAMCDKAALACRFVRPSQVKHYEIYGDSAAAIYQQETKLLGELESAIIDQVFIPYYQPIVDCKTKQIVSAEALVRWVHPEKGILTPKMFIPILEKKELIPALDSIMTEKVSSMIKRQEDSGAPIVPISINLSRIDLYDNKLMDQISKMIREKGSTGVRYRFEITESVYESLPDSIAKKLSDFRASGVQILVDDFGTGYSSLGMITDYEFDYIKLDMAFASKLETSEKMRGVVSALIEMVHKLGAKVIVEGVETGVQYSYLAAAGCDMIQGYLFHKAMPEQAFLELLQKQEEESRGK